VALKTVETLGLEDVLMWASDYPHFDCTFPGVVEELYESCVELDEDVQDKIKGGNAARCYGLG
jgi:predicted TIM-barrel fold metal-dependent hydrolase